MIDENRQLLIDREEVVKILSNPSMMVMQCIGGGDLSMEGVGERLKN
jgi:hypothetical protein